MPFLEAKFCSLFSFILNFRSYCSCLPWRPSFVAYKRPFSAMNKGRIVLRAKALWVESFLLLFFCEHSAYQRLATFVAPLCNQGFSRQVLVGSWVFEPRFLETSSHWVWGIFPFPLEFRLSWVWINLFVWSRSFISTGSHHMLNSEILFPNCLLNNITCETLCIEIHDSVQM